MCRGQTDTAGGPCKGSDQLLTSTCIAFSAFHSGFSILYLNDGMIAGITLSYLWETKLHQYKVSFLAYQLHIGLFAVNSATAPPVVFLTLLFIY